jgi:MFS family permease
MRFAAICVFFFTGVMLTLAIPAAVVIVVLAAFVQGVASQFFSVLWWTTLQKKVPGNMLSRISAYDHLGSIALAPMGIVVGGYLFEALGYRLTLIIAALVTIIPTALVLCVRDVRMMTTD